MPHPSVPVVEFAIVKAGTADCNITGSRVLFTYSQRPTRPHIPELGSEPGVLIDAIRPRFFPVGATDNSIVVVGDTFSHRIHTDAIGQAPFRDGFGGSASDEKPFAYVLYLSGSIVYTGADHVTRTTYFHRMYDFEAERFVRTGDPDDEMTH